MKQYDFTTKSLEELLEIVENPNDYQSRFIDMATKEIALRTPSKGQIRTITEKLYQEKCKKMVEGSLFQFDLLELPYSKFISEKRRKSILLKELKAFKNKRDMMNDGLAGYGTSGV
jgi:hypothetical protein